MDNLVEMVAPTGSIVFVPQHRVKQLCDNGFAVVRNDLEIQEVPEETESQEVPEDDQKPDVKKKKKSESPDDKKEELAKE